MSRIDWQSPTWGKPGHNVHEDSHGSWVPSAHGEDQ